MVVMRDLITDRIINEVQQGEAYFPLTQDAKAYEKRFYIESYGCQMNFADSEVVASILEKEGFGATAHETVADVILINS